MRHLICGLGNISSTEGQGFPPSLIVISMHPSRSESRTHRKVRDVWGTQGPRITTSLTEPSLLSRGTRLEKWATHRYGSCGLLCRESFDQSGKFIDRGFQCDWVATKPVVERVALPSFWCNHPAQRGYTGSRELDV